MIASVPSGFVKTYIHMPFIISFPPVQFPFWIHFEHSKTDLVNNPTSLRFTIFKTNYSRYKFHSFVVQAILQNFYKNNFKHFQICQI